MELSEIINYYLEILSNKNKTVVLLGDFNEDILKYKKHSNISEFLDIMYPNLLLQHIARPTHATAKSETIIDNIFSNNYDYSFTSGNLVITMSDHHA